MWHEFPAGPTGLFLKKGREVRVRRQRAVSVRAPAVSARPRRGAPVLRQVLHVPAGRGAVCLAVGHQRVRRPCTPSCWRRSCLRRTCSSPRARRPPSRSCVGAGYFLVTVTPGYVVWMTPELFNLATVTLAYFCWLYKEVAPRGAAAWAAMAAHALVRCGRGRAAGDGVVLQAAQRRADRAHRAAGLVAPPLVVGTAGRRRASRCCWRACSSATSRSPAI